MKTLTARCIAIFAVVLLPGLLLAQTIPSFPTFARVSRVNSLVTPPAKNSLYIAMIKNK
jgi:hypothetical protein